jgi:L-aminopeptidase/D-esterase-like protein
MIWELDGLRVGHVTHTGARTGCTVVLADPAARASGEVRGSAPANREFSLLDPTATVERVDAVVLSGGSAFGLAAADGVVDWLDEHGRGFPTRWGRVPIVVGMSLFDLPTGDPSVRPSATDGYAAAAAAATGSGSRELGPVGAGAGATVGKWRGADQAVDAGLVGAVVRDGPLVVACLVAVNAWGDVVGSGRWDEPEPAITSGTDPASSDAFTNTTIGVVATNGALDKIGLHHVARGAHDGLARAVSPPHASVDGDAFVALGTGSVDAPLDRVRWMAVKAVEQAITGGVAG